MEPLKINPRGLWSLLGALAVLTLAVIAWPKVLRLWVWLLDARYRLPSESFDLDWCRLAAWAVILGLLIGAAIRYARRI